MITKTETFDKESQTVRVILRNEHGTVVADMTLPLVVAVMNENKEVTGFRRYDVDRDIESAIAMHTKRHAVFTEAAKARGHLK